MRNLLLAILILNSICSSCNSKTENEDQRQKSEEVRPIENKQPETDSNKIISASDREIINKLLEINKREYIGKSVALFLSNDTIKAYKEYRFIAGKPGVVSFLSLKYSQKVFVEIEVNTYQYLQPFNRNENWPLNLYKKEKISEIRVVVNDKPIEIII